MLAMAIFLVRGFGFFGVLAGSFFASAGVTLAVSQSLNSRMFGVPFSTMVSWILPSWIFLMTGCLLGWLAAKIFPAGNAFGENLRIHILLAAVLGLLSFRFCLRSEIRHEILSRILRRA